MGTEQTLGDEIMILKSICTTKEQKLHALQVFIDNENDNLAHLNNLKKFEMLAIISFLESVLGKQLRYKHDRGYSIQLLNKPELWNIIKKLYAEYKEQSHDECTGN